MKELLRQTDNSRLQGLYKPEHVYTRITGAAADTLAEKLSLTRSLAVFIRADVVCIRNILTARTRRSVQNEGTNNNPLTF